MNGGKMKIGGGEKDKGEEGEEGKSEGARH